MNTLEARIAAQYPTRKDADDAFRDACAAVLGVESVKAYASLRTLRIGTLSIDFRTDG